MYLKELDKVSIKAIFRFQTLKLYSTARTFKVGCKATIKNCIKFIVLRNFIQKLILQVSLKYQISLYKYHEDDCTFFVLTLLCALFKKNLLQKEEYF